MNSSVVLVTGGAGYIGSHMVKMLRWSGFTPIVIDDLSNGNPEAVLGAELIVGDINDRHLIDAALVRHHPAAVMHFAGSIEVGESIGNPAKYYHNNVLATHILLECMLQHGINKCVFSSTAAIFGNPEYTPIDEHHPCRPINPYGRGKLVVEQMLDDYDAAYGLKSICFRYFNAAGADPDGELGESHDPETHLIPLVLQVASGRRPALTINGNDYSTADGTCIRDYVHVEDLCSAHIMALKQLLNDGDSACYNLGNGSGFSVLDIVKSVERITGRKVHYSVGPRRAGDPPVLVADARKARLELNWTPQFTHLDTIIAHAWRWEQMLAAKYL